MSHFQLRQPLLNQLRVSGLTLRPQQLIEQPDIGKHCRKQFAIIFRLFAADRFAIQQDFAALWLIQARQQHRQRRFSTTVATNQKQQLATFNGEVNRPNGKRIILISKRHVTQLQRLPVGKRLRAWKLCFERCEREFVQLVKRHLRRQQRR
ncbi:hypothetical protein HmCmsJML278_01136 [Escherichia coli]|nr:hypothetical protein HmCmsJML278_01136 [Escherichia coli]